MIQLSSVSVLVLKLRLTDTFEVDIDKRRNPVLKVNDEVIHYVQAYCEGYSPYKVKRSVLGTSLHIPSAYRQDHLFAEGQYHDPYRGIA